MEPCFECGKPAKHNHHVIPKCKGGTKTIPLCVACHGKVHDSNMVRWAELCRLGMAAARKAGKRWGGSKKGWRWKVSDEQVIAIKEMKAAGEKIASISRATGLSRPTIYRVLQPGSPIGNGKRKQLPNSSPKQRRSIRAKRILAGQAVARRKGKKWGGSKPGWRWKVSDDQVIAIREMKAAGKKIAQIAGVTGLSRPTIYRVLKGAA